jgi:bifunctional DNase/RNase
MLVKIEFAAFGIDPKKNSPIVFFRETGGIRMLPVPVGPLEASAIAIETLKVTVQKPLTIDVAKSILEQFGGTLSRTIFFLDGSAQLMARLEITGPDRTRSIMCRPCDGIALALRTRSPLYTYEEVLSQYCRDGKTGEGDALRNHIASLDTLEFGTFHLE